MPKHYFSRLEHLDILIRTKSTGSPDQLATKLSVSKRTIFEYLDILKSLGAEIKYCKVRKSYCYYIPGKFDFKFKTALGLSLLIGVIQLVTYL
jgi:predicted DNA-binding transcriptional regulator YafY